MQSEFCTSFQCGLAALANFRMHSGIQWNELPKEFGEGSSVHRTFQQWVARSVFARRGEDLGNGTKRGVLTEADGGPIAVVVTGANVHDSLPLQDALEQAVIQPPDPFGHDQPSLRAATSMHGMREMNWGLQSRPRF